MTECNDCIYLGNIGALPCTACKEANGCYHLSLKSATVDQDIKADAGKLRPSLVPPAIIDAIAAVREYGVEKYGDAENWREVDPQRYRDALLRHILAWWQDPSSSDYESGYPHIYHVATNAAFLIDMGEGVVNL